uniref:Uncharacterized protein n=2 Tax=Mustela TaxID=9665 RepID=M3Z100_MUSPF
MNSKDPKKCPQCKKSRNKAQEEFARKFPYRFSWLTEPTTEFLQPWEVTKMSTSLRDQLPLQKTLVPTRSIPVRGMGSAASPGSARDRSDYTHRPRLSAGACRGGTVMGRALLEDDTEPRTGGQTEAVGNVSGSSGGRGAPRPTRAQHRWEPIPPLGGTGLGPQMLHHCPACTLHHHRHLRANFGNSS